MFRVFAWTTSCHFPRNPWTAMENGPVMFDKFQLLHQKIHRCVWKCRVPHCTQWFCWSLSRHEKWLAIIGNINPTFSGPKPHADFPYLRLPEVCDHGNKTMFYLSNRYVSIFLYNKTSPCYHEKMTTPAPVLPGSFWAPQETSGGRNFRMLKPPFSGDIVGYPLVN